MSTADGFAGRMRELKERSGLSYGVLARRLHVSASTLHRYCNGDAVPAEFAPVERLGRLCGASRDELIELHRAWIVADEARRQGQSQPQPPAQSPAQAQTQPSAEESPVAPAPVPVPVPVVEAVPEAVDSPVVEVLAGPEAPVRGRSRRGVLAGAAAVAAVAVAVPLVYVLASGDKPAGDDAKGSEGPPAPLSAGISSYNWAEPCGQYYVLDQAPEHVPPPPAPQDTRGWARALGGIDGGHMQLQITVTGRTQEPVVLSGLNVRVVQREEPLDGTTYSMGDGCGSGITPQTFDVDLDAPRPFVKPVAGQDGDRVVPAKNFPYKVATGDPQVLNLDVHTEKYAATWYLELKWSSGEQHGTVRVDDGGKPFRSSAIEGRPTYGYRIDTGAWDKQ
ncbi:helix-turn-helix domain-containing protein [Streptomyces laurentii]|uniref:helix-turn-helix domain-containing protein n=1 Tax=Streptomyces laurentii TaxID=39478 RepID=UPI003692A8DA